MYRIIYFWVILSLGIFFSSTTCGEAIPVKIENNSSDTIYFSTDPGDVELTSYIAFKKGWAMTLPIPPGEFYEFLHVYEKHDSYIDLQIAIFSISTIKKYGMEKIVDLNIMDAYYRINPETCGSKEIKITYNGEKYDDRSQQ